MSLEDAADTLRDLVDAMPSQEKVKEDRILVAYSRLTSTKNEITGQVEQVFQEVIAFRDSLVGEVIAWCEGHLQRLESMGRSREATLTRQRDDLQDMIDRLASHRKNMSRSSRSTTSPRDTIQSCLRLLQKVSALDGYF